MLLVGRILGLLRRILRAGAIVVVTWLALWIAGIVAAELSAGLAMLKSAMLRRTEGVLAGWRGEAGIVVGSWRGLAVLLVRIRIVVGAGHAVSCRRDGADAGRFGFLEVGV